MTMFVCLFTKITSNIQSPPASVEYKFPTDLLIQSVDVCFTVTPDLDHKNEHYFSTSV